MAGTIVVDRIESDGSYASTINVASKVNFTGGMQIGGQDTTFAGMRNRIINGAMMIDQRQLGVQNSPSNASAYTVDRWKMYSTASKFSVQQSTLAPPGFKNSLLITSLSAYTPGATEEFEVYQYIEGLNMADFAWGTSSASPMTISFWVRSSLTGTFGGAFKNGAGTRTFPYSYTINQANTWEYKTIVIPGETTGVWTIDNTAQFQLFFDIGTGSTYKQPAGSWTTNFANGPTGGTNLISTNGATLYITGVQIEKGSVATPFENRLYGQELALCQRYYNIVPSSGSSWFAGVCWSTNRVLSALQANGPWMRATPTVSCPANTFVWFHGGGAYTSSVTTATVGNINGNISIDITVQATTGTPGSISLNQPITLSAEL